MKNFTPLIILMALCIFEVQSQNVGISDGLFTPQSPLHVFRNTDANMLQLSKSSTANTGLIFSVTGNNWTMRNWHDGELQLRTGNSFMTFYTNGLERMRVLNDGRVGIGTSVPTDKVTIDGQGSNDVMRLRGSGTNAAGAYLRFGDMSGAYIQEDIDDGLYIYSIDRKAFMGGNVGIGDATPLALLTVGNGDLFRVLNTGHVRTINGTAGNPSYSFTGSITSGMYSGGANTILFSTNSTERVRIDANGRVGIGTNAPSATLHVVGPLRLQGLDPPGAEQTALFIDANGYVKARVLDPAAFGGFTEMDTLAWLRAGNTASAGDIIGTLNAVDFRIFTNGSERMRVSAAGNVGIGTLSPAHRLDVSFDGSDRVARIRNISNTGGAHGMLISTVRTSSDAYILNLDAAGSTRMYVRSDGNVGIGTNSPTAQLHTTGTVRIANYPSGANGAIVRTDNSGNLGITNFTGNANDVLLGSGVFGPLPAQVSAWELTGNAGTNPGANFLGTTDNADMVIRTNNSERMRISNSGFIGINSAPSSAYQLNVYAASGSSGIYSSVTASGANQHAVSAYSSGNISGTDYGYGLSANAVQGYSFWGNAYRFGVAGYRYDDAAGPSAGVFGAVSSVNPPAAWGALGFQDASSGEWGGYFTGRGYFSNNLGVNSTNPTERLHVEGNVRFSGALMPNNQAGTNGQVLVSQGAGVAPQWQTPSNLPMYGNNAHSVTLNSLTTNTDQVNWTDIPGMTITFTPVHTTFYIFASFCARLADNNGYAQLGQALVEGRVLVNGLVVAKAAAVITDYDQDYWGGEYLVTSGTIAFSGVRANATIGSSTTVRIQWRPVVVWADSPWRLEINPTVASDHCVLTVFD